MGLSDLALLVGGICAIVAFAGWALVVGSRMGRS